MTSKEIGTLAEDKASAYLIHKGYTIITRNFTSRGGEIDIIAQDNSNSDNTLVFIEVKYRADPSFGWGVEFVTPTKIKRILKTANYYLYKHHLYDENIRFDVIQLHGTDFELTHYENAFGG